MRIFGIFDLFCGYWRVEVPAEKAERMINAVFRAGIPHGEFRRLPDGTLTFKMSRKGMRELRYIIDKSGFVGYSLYRGGLPFIIRRYRARVGFFVGAALFLAVSYLSTLFIWRVEVVSDTTLNKTAVESNLEKLGVRPGAFIPSCDFWALSAEYLTTFDDCAWLSINMNGTVAEVELRERLPPDDKVSRVPCNVVAAEGGVIDSFVISSGRGYVTPGVVVKKGDLLVSGVIEDLQGSYRLVGAEAEIYAETERTVTVEAPFTRIEREFTGREEVSRTLIFFGLEFELPFGEGSHGEGWEETRDRASPVLPDGKPLPCGIETVTRREFTEREVPVSPEEARAEAEARLDRAIADQLPGVRVLSVIKEINETDTGVVATARVRCICDIAEKREIISEVQTGE